MFGQTIEAPLTDTPLRQSLLRIRDLDRDGVVSILDRATLLKANAAVWPTYPRFVLGLVFFEPSTRTMLGFESAAARLGGLSVLLTEPRFLSGTVLRESLEDTIRVVSAYCDVLVMRHPDERAIDRAQNVSEAPIINGGNGHEEHPTQALIDLFAIRNWHGRLDSLHIGIAGDLSSSRASHSLVRALQFFDPAEIRLMYPDGRGLPAWVTGMDRLPIEECRNRLRLQDLDVLYVAGLPDIPGQKKLSEQQRETFRLTARTIKNLPDAAVILSPLPRIDEIDAVLDERPNAQYFPQSRDGLFVRGAVLEHVLGGRTSSLGYVSGEEHTNPESALQTHSTGERGAS